VSVFVMRVQGHKRGEIVSNRDEIILRFRPLRDSVPWPHRVRRLLKYALRACNLRCEGIEHLPFDVPLETHRIVQDRRTENETA
jgi:hypothetical protein